MIYNTPTRGEDGMYHVKAITDEKKRCFVQLSNVKVTEVDNDAGEVSFEVTDEDNQAKLNVIHVSNLQSALENSKEWFGPLTPLKYIYNFEVNKDNIDFILLIIWLPSFIFLFYKIYMWL